MTPNHHVERKASKLVGLAKAVGIIAGAAIAAATVLHFIGQVSYGIAIAPVRAEVRASADTLSDAIRRNRWDARRSDDTLRFQILELRYGQEATLREVRDVHQLLLRRFR